MTITASEALQRTIEHREIFHDEMLHLMRMIMGGEITPLMTAAILTGLRVKKETIGEITAAAQVMREFSTKVEVADHTHLVDIVGTGGDGSHPAPCLSLPPPVRVSASMAGAASAAKAAAPMCWKIWVSISTSHLLILPNALLRQASASCLHPITIRR